MITKIKQNKKISGLKMEKIELPLGEYSQAQKLDLLDRIWDDLRQNEEELESPDWHEPILAKRKVELDSGQAETLEWSDELKAEIKKEALCK
ncbi:MAG: addiction module protein [Thermodesulfobacteriota bacterium]|nr:addiction module protein [Thermodesulfobacteriota bacterium]